MVLKGIYILIIRLEKNASLVIGSLGIRTFRKGLYAYVGSAQKNLEQRVKRHLRKEKQKFWHIDYLLDSNDSIIAEIFYRLEKKPEECNVANLIAKSGELVKGFGCSDCRCKSHLFRIENTQFLRKNMHTLNLKPENVSPSKILLSQKNIPLNEE